MNNSEIDLAINAEDSNPHAVQYHCLAPLIASKIMAVVLIAVTVQTRLINAVWHNRLVCCFCYDHLQGSCQWAQSNKAPMLLATNSCCIIQPEQTLLQESWHTQRLQSCSINTTEQDSINIEAHGPGMPSPNMGTCANIATCIQAQPVLQCHADAQGMVCKPASLFCHSAVQQQLGT
jgi:hypothetical protein